MVVDEFMLLEEVPDLLLFWWQSVCLLSVLCQVLAEAKFCSLSYDWKRFQWQETPTVLGCFLTLHTSHALSLGPCQDWTEKSFITRIILCIGYGLASGPGKGSRSQRMWLCDYFLCARYIHVHVPVCAHVCVCVQVDAHVYLCTCVNGIWIQKIISVSFLRSQLPYFLREGFSLRPGAAD